MSPYFVFSVLWPPSEFVSNEDEAAGVYRLWQE
jgi:hypothetical protein